MTRMRKITISIMDELDDALESISLAKSASKSRIIDTLLYEHPLVKRYVDIIRSEPDVGLFAVPTKERTEQNPRKESTVTPKSSP